MATEANDVSPADRDQSLRAAAIALRSGDVGALEIVWDLCAADLYGLARSRCRRPEDAEDAVQDVFLKLAQSPDIIARARSPRAYMLTMVHRALIDISRRRSEDPLDPLVVPAVAAPDMARTIDAQKATGLMARLSPPLRRALRLRYFVESSFGEIAKTMGVPMFTAASRHRLALARLRLWMQGRVPPDKEEP